MLKLKLQYFVHLMQTANSLRSPWCWERLRAEREEGVRGWDGWMASPIQWTWTWANFGRWLGTGRPRVLQSMGHKELDTIGWLNNNNVHCSIIYNWQDMETTQVPINRWMDEENMYKHTYTYIHTMEHYTHTHTYIHKHTYSGTLHIHTHTHTHIHTYNGNITQPWQKKRNLAICNSVNGHRGHYTKWNKLDRERQTLYDFTYMWNLKNKTNKQTQQNRNRVIIQRRNRCLPEGRKWGYRRQIGGGD